MTNYADLEISLVPRDGTGKYNVGLSLRLPHSDVENEPLGYEPAVVAFDLDALGQLASFPVKYGEALTESLFAPPVVNTFFGDARAAAGSAGVPLRVRLRIPRETPELHELRWETLRDPKAGANAFLFADETIPFSRYLSSDDWRPVTTRPTDELRALVVIASPANRGDWQLAEIKVAEELERAKVGLGDIKTDALCRLGDEETLAPGVDIVGLPTLNGLVSRLRERYDILYLVCHGKLQEMQVDGIKRTVPKVWLEDEQGRADVVSPYEDRMPDGGRRPGLVTRMRQLLQLPRLIVLSSCESGGVGGEWASADGGALVALGPILAEAGVPAVIAMQGKIKMKTVEQFVPVFFEELRRTGAEGQIDRAVAAARAKLVGQQGDWWAPTLFMRLRSGRIGWYEPRFSGVEQQWVPWEGLVSAITTQDCTPILGPGLIEFLIGSRSEIAECWAKDIQPGPFPLARHCRRSLHLVAQYLATMQGNPHLPQTKLVDRLSDELQRRHGDRLTGQPGEAEQEELWERIRHANERLRLPDNMWVEQLMPMVQEVGFRFRRADEADPYRVLALLPVPIYINANPDNLLYDALAEVGRKPRIGVCPWNDEVVQPDPDFDEDPGYQPSIDEPLVYHLFGHLSQLRSVILSEDHFFDYLVWVSTQNALPHPSIPDGVTEAWSGNALMFLGFQLQEWSFSVLLHSIVNPQGGQKTDRPRSLAVQVSPNEGLFEHPEGAREYIRQSLSGSREIKMSVYWGTSQVFLRKLWDLRSRHRWLPPKWA